MKRLLALICALSLSAPVLAQAPAPDPALEQGVRELLTQMKYREQLAARMQQAAQAMPQAMLKAQAERINANARLTDAQKKAELAIVANDVGRVAQEGQRVLADPKTVDDILARVVVLYAKQLTLAEVNELVAFYRTPAATKMQALLPQVAQETGQLVQDALRERMLAAVARGRKQEGQ